MNLEQNVISRFYKQLRGVHHEDDLRLENHYFKVFSEIAIGLMERQDSSAFSQKLIEEAVNIVGADFGYIHLVNESEDRLNIKAVCNTTVEVVGKIKIEKGVGVAGIVWQSAKAVLVNDYENWPNRYIDDRINAMKAAIGVPMLNGGKVVGVIGLGALTRDRFTMQHVEILWQFSHLSMIALDNTSLIEQISKELERSESLTREIRQRERRYLDLLKTTQRRLAHAQTLISISKLVSSTASMNDMVDKIADETKAALQCDSAGIVRLHDGESENSVVGSATAAGAEAVPMDARTFKEMIDSSILQASSVVQKLPSADSFAKNKGSNPALQERRYQAISIIRNGEAVWGAVVATRSAEADPFDEEDQQTLDGIASQLSLAVLQRDQVNRMEYQASHDELTGLPNRRLFKQGLQSLQEQVLQQGDQPQSKAEVILIDLDGFKQVNDRFGHRAGDLLLIEVAKRLSCVVSDTAILARLGGDEFAILAPIETVGTVATDLADQLLSELRRPFRVDEKDIQIDASLGICVYPDDGQDFSTLLNAADSAMYAVKRRGKSGKLNFSAVHKAEFGLSKQAREERSDASQTTSTATG